MLSISTSSKNYLPITNYTTNNTSFTNSTAIPINNYNTETTNNNDNYNLHNDEYEKIPFEYSLADCLCGDALSWFSGDAVVGRRESDGVVGRGVCDGVVGRGECDGVMGRGECHGLVENCGKGYEEGENKDYFSFPDQHSGKDKPSSDKKPFYNNGDLRRDYENEILKSPKSLNFIDLNENSAKLTNLCNNTSAIHPQNSFEDRKTTDYKERLFKKSFFEVKNVKVKNKERLKSYDHGGCQFSDLAAMSHGNVPHKSLGGSINTESHLKSCARSDADTEVFTADSSYRNDHLGKSFKSPNEDGNFRNILKNNNDNMAEYTDMNNNKSSSYLNKNANLSLPDLIKSVESKGCSSCREINHENDASKNTNNSCNTSKDRNRREHLDCKGGEKHDCIIVEVNNYLNSFVENTNNSNKNNSCNNNNNNSYDSADKNNRKGADDDIERKKKGAKMEECHEVVGDDRGSGDKVTRKRADLLHRGVKRNNYGSKNESINSSFRPNNSSNARSIYSSDVKKTREEEKSNVERGVGRGVLVDERSGKVRVMKPREVCDVCGKQFASVAARQRHALFHVEVRPYRCELCGIGFKLKVHLKKHNLYKHTDDYPCECRVCGKRFKDSSAVRLHERIHSSERPFQCQCGKSFKTKENLWGHRHRRPCIKYLIQEKAADEGKRANKKTASDCMEKGDARKMRSSCVYYSTSSPNRALNYEINSLVNSFPQYHQAPYQYPPSHLTSLPPFESLVGTKTTETPLYLARNLQHNNYCFSNNPSCDFSYNKTWNPPERRCVYNLASWSSGTADWSAYNTGYAVSDETWMPSATRSTKKVSETKASNYAYYNCLYDEPPPQQAVCSFQGWSDSSKSFEKYSLL